MSKIISVISKNMYIYAFVLFIIVILLTIFSNYISIYTNSNNAFIDIIYVFTNSLISILSLGVLWQLIEKKLFAQELFNLARISTNLKDSGVSYYYDSFLDINWDSQFNQSKQLKIFFTYGLTFGQNNRIKIENAIRNGLEVSIFYPNYKSEVIYNELTVRFNKQGDPNWLVSKINESIELFKSLGAKVYIFEGNITNSYYMFDNYSYISFFNHDIQKKSVPCFEVKKDGKLFKFIQQEIQSIESRSILL